MVWSEFWWPRVVRSQPQNCLATVSLTRLAAYAIVAEHRRLPVHDLLRPHVRADHTRVQPQVRSSLVALCVVAESLSVVCVSAQLLPRVPGAQQPELGEVPELPLRGARAAAVPAGRAPAVAAQEELPQGVRGAHCCVYVRWCRPERSFLGWIV